ncbi:MAG: sulfate adenylyltransferase [Dehalococcoidia bacterium]|nr:sulfate adenylyltransferase [Dehalococcoidia bacterium]
MTQSKVILKTAEGMAPHGGELVNLEAPKGQVDQLTKEAQGLKKVRLGSKETSDLEMLGIGAFSPLAGFMNRDDYMNVVKSMHLANGLLWSVPVTLSVSSDAASSLKEGEKIALVGESGTTLATMMVQDKYTYNKAVEAENVYRTTEEAHPGVAAMYGQEDVLIGGPVSIIQRPPHDNLQEYRLTPAETRAAFAEKGWQRIVGFQTRNPVHRAHEYIQKCALEAVDGLLLHPLVGDTKGDDIPADVRMRCYQVLLENYYPKDRVLLSVMPAAMRYAGPREAIFHALIRKNYGCTHFIVGRDHAGVGTYYGTYDAQDLLKQQSPEELGITPLYFDNTFFCKKCEGMASLKTCPHDSSNHISLSGTQVRNMLAAGELPPPEFSRPEVARVLIESMKN